MPQQDRIKAAAQRLHDGELVAFPTETVYGLGADAHNPAAVAQIFARKGRPAHHPLIVHLPAIEHVSEWADKPDARLLELADAYWPGPLTLVCPRSSTVPLAVTGGLDTVGLRVPDHPVATALLREFGGGVAAPSANRFGRVSPTTAAAVHEELGPDIYVLDGGPTSVGVESTIVTVEEGSLVLLRHGGISIEQIRAVTGELTDDSHGRSRASGMMISHYSPSCRIILRESYDEPADQASPTSHQAIMGLASELPEDLPELRFTMSSLQEYAQRLYSSMRAADSLGVEELLVVLPPAVGLGAAIRDRLQRAASPRTGEE